MSDQKKFTVIFTAEVQAKIEVKATSAAEAEDKASTLLNENDFARSEINVAEAVTAAVRNGWSTKIGDRKEAVKRLDKRKPDTRQDPCSAHPDGKHIFSGMDGLCRCGAWNAGCCTRCSQYWCDCPLKNDEHEQHRI